MNIGRLLKSIANAAIKEARKNPKAAALVVATIVGGSAGAAVKKGVEKAERAGL
ncbi:MAG TPA: hypothetical protein VF695_06265 [Sphingomonas sp.]|jgi:hypothetical protein